MRNTILALQHFFADVDSVGFYAEDKDGNNIGIEKDDDGYSGNIDIKGFTADIESSSAENILKLVSDFSAVTSHTY